MISNLLPGVCIVINESITVFHVGGLLGTDLVAEGKSCLLMNV